MNFKKFVKTIATSGILYERPSGDRWLASGQVYMRIPDNVRSVTGVNMADMPKFVESLIDGIGGEIECDLRAAIMPDPYGTIKDCLRRYVTRDGEYSIDLSNDDWKFIEHGDYTAIQTHYDAEDGCVEAVALMVYEYPSIADDDLELVGIIFPTTSEE